jgi:predicted glycogen debranching enzyme
MLVSFEPRVLIRYTLVEAHSPTTLRLKPFLAYRNTNELTHENDSANTDVREVENGRVAKMYELFPELYMQCSKKVEYTHAPAWYKDIEYMKEQERGFSYKEDQLVPGWFEMPIKKGESVIFAAGISEVNPKSLKTLWEKELKRRSARNDMFNSLKIAAQQFYKREGDKCYLLAGYPWFKASAREEFMAMSGCTIGIGRPEYWDVIVNNTAVEEVRNFMEGKECKLVGMDEPDALLWFIRAIQEYASYTSIEEVTRLYGQLIIDIMLFIRRQQHPRLFLHNNGLLWVNGKERPATWMNAVEDGRPITPRTGYVVEINALWYNARLFTANIQRQLGKEQIADLMEYQAEITKDSFVKTFWNGTYLDDYVDGDYHNNEVRPNQIIAASLPYSPLDRLQRKAVVDICTKELYTPKGLRTISPKSGSYRPEYIGGQLERDRNFHNGPVWPWTISAYATAYLKVYQHSGESFIRRLLTGYEAEMSELCIGTLNELYDGNPPFKGHGGMSYAPSVASVIEVCNTLEKFSV